MISLQIPPHLGPLLVKHHGNAIGKLGLLRHRHYMVYLDALGHVHAQVVGARQRGHVLQRLGVEDADDGLGAADEYEALVDADTVGVGGAALHPLVQQAPRTELHQMALPRDGVRALRTHPCRRPPHRSRCPANHPEWRSDPSGE